MNDLNVGPVLSNSDQWLIIPIENYITFDSPGRCFYCQSNFGLYAPNLNRKQDFDALCQVCDLGLIGMAVMISD